MCPMRIESLHEFNIQHPVEHIDGFLTHRPRCGPFASINCQIYRHTYNIEHHICVIHAIHRDDNRGIDQNEILAAQN